MPIALRSKDKPTNLEEGDLYHDSTTSRWLVCRECSRSWLACPWKVARWSSS